MLARRIRPRWTSACFAVVFSLLRLVKVLINKTTPTAKPITSATTPKIFRDWWLEVDVCEFVGACAAEVGLVVGDEVVTVLGLGVGKTVGYCGLEVDF